MPAQYPNEIFTPRTMVNRPGVVYDETKTKRIYAEDFNNPHDEIVAIETELGLNAKGSAASVSERIEALELIVFEISSLDSDPYPVTSPYILGSNNEDVLNLDVQTNRIYVQLPLTPLAKPVRIVNIGNDIFELSENSDETYSAQFRGVVTFSDSNYTPARLSICLDRGHFILVPQASINPNDPNTFRYPISDISRVCTRDAEGGGWGSNPDVTNPEQPKRWTLTEIQYNNLTGTDEGVQSADDEHTHGSLLSGITEDVSVLVDYDPVTETKTFSTLHFDNGIYIGKD